MRTGKYATPYDRMRYGSYRQTRGQALSRGFEWELTFDEWWAAWDNKWVGHKRLGRRLILNDGETCYAAGKVHVAELRKLNK
jgi:hypothetical protein